MSKKKNFKFTKKSFLKNLILVTGLVNKFFLKSQLA